MLELARGLTPAALDAIAELERRTVAADGGRLKLEWSTLRNRSGETVEDVLWWDGDRLLGFVGLYSFGDVELAGMVDPQARRKGIGGALLDAARAQRAERPGQRTLLIVPRASAAGAVLARQRGGTLDHSEHALVLDGEPVDGPDDAGVTVRPAVEADLPTIGRLLEAAFDWHPPDLAERLVAERAETYVIDCNGETVGTLRLPLHDGVGGVYGFAVDPDRQGRGIGRQALRKSCRLLRAEGATRVGLEVAVDNEHALGLYTSLGFSPKTTEDYYALPLVAAVAAVPVAPAAPPQ